MAGKICWRIPFRCVYCNHRGEWVTVYVQADTFMEAVEYLMDKLDMWVIKEVSERLENGELVGKKIETVKK